VTTTTSLFRLQKLDLEIERHDQELTMVRRGMAGNPQLRAAEKRLADMETQERETATKQRRLEADLAALEIQIKRDQARMYGGMIVDARELASLEKEIQHHAVQLDALEGQVLIGMESMESLQQMIANAREQTGALGDQWRNSRPGAKRQVEEQESSLARLNSERNALAATLDARALGVYGRLRSTVGHAISPLSGGICGECRIAVPSKDVQRVRSGDLVSCANCGRILHGAV